MTKDLAVELFMISKLGEHYYFRYEIVNNCTWAFLDWPCGVIFSSEQQIKRVNISCGYYPSDVHE